VTGAVAKQADPDIDQIVAPRAAQPFGVP